MGVNKGIGAPLFWINDPNLERAEEVGAGITASLLQPQSFLTLILAQTFK